MRQCLGDRNAWQGGCGALTGASDINCYKWSQGLQALQVCSECGVCFQAGTVDAPQEETSTMSAGLVVVLVLLPLMLGGVGVGGYQAVKRHRQQQQAKPPVLPVNPLADADDEPRAQPRAPQQNQARGIQEDQYLPPRAENFGGPQQQDMEAGRPRLFSDAVPEPVFERGIPRSLAEERSGIAEVAERNAVASKSAAELALAKSKAAAKAAEERERVAVAATAAYGKAEDENAEAQSAIEVAEKKAAASKAAADIAQAKAKDAAQAAEDRESAASAAKAAADKAKENAAVARRKAEAARAARQREAAPSQSASPSGPVVRTGP